MKMVNRERLEIHRWVSEVNGKTLGELLDLCKGNLKACNDSYLEYDYPTGKVDLQWDEEETDEEMNTRIDLEEKYEKQYKERLEKKKLKKQNQKTKKDEEEYQNYLKLKEKYENV